jgi:beta-lactamase regulating signal transducer with metallopeptidase domain
MTRYLFDIIPVLFLAAAIGWDVYAANTDRKSIRRNYPYRGPGVTYYMPLVWVVTCLFRSVLLLLLGASLSEIKQRLINILLPLLFSVCVFICILLLILPLLRRFLSPGACAFLWTLPSIAAYLYRFHEDTTPLWVLKIPLMIPSRIGTAALAVWAAGFCVIFLWQVVSHLLFRRKLVGMAWAVTDPRILQIWKQELIRAKLNKTDPALLISPQTATPMSIGVFTNSLCVVLPYKKEYTDEELTLIFRHELAHIQGKDSFTKLNLMLYTALLWFHPFMWTAMRRCAEDLELSCDRYIVRDASPETRRLYAGLILNTAGDSRGFTTALATSAGSIRHRLRGIVSEKRRYPGGLLCFLLTAAILMTFFVDLGFGGQTGDAMLFHWETPGEVRLVSVDIEDHEFEGSDSQSRDGAQVVRYLCGQKIWKLVAWDIYIPRAERISFTLLAGRTQYSFITDGQFLIVTETDDLGSVESIYYFETPLNRAQLAALLLSQATAPQAAPPAVFFVTASFRAVQNFFTSFFRFCECCTYSFANFYFF